MLATALRFALNDKITVANHMLAVLFFLQRFEHLKCAAKEFCPVADFNQG